MTFRLAVVFPSSAASSVVPAAVFGVLAAILVGLAAFGQESKVADASPATTCSAGAKVMAAKPAQIAMEDTILVSGPKLGSLACAGPGRPLVLFLDWLPLRDVTAEVVGDDTLRFRLLRGASSKANWDLLLGRPRTAPRSMPISVGYADGRPVESAAMVDLVTLPPLGFASGLVVFLILAGAFLRLAARSDMIRSGPSKTLGVRGPFSLSRTQAAWWFFVVLAAYLFIGLVTGDFTTSLNGTALGLIGLGGGTAIGAALIGSSQDTLATQQRAKAAQSRVDAIRPSATTHNDIAKLAAIDKVQAVLCNDSQGFLLDILSDADGVCFHRFQIVAWTIVLTGTFLVGVYENLAMPDFDPTTFGLLGLSSLTYLGLKNTEAVVPKTPAVQTAAGDVPSG